MIRKASGLPELSRTADQRIEMAAHVAAVVQAGELIGDRHLQAELDIVAQPVGIAFLAQLGAHARDQFVLVDRTRQIIVDAHLQRLGQLAPVAVGHHHQDRHIAPFGQRAQLRAQAQAIKAAQAEADDDEVVIAAAHAHDGLLEGIDGGDVIGRRSAPHSNQATDSGRSSMIRMRPSILAADRLSAGSIRPIFWPVASRMRSSSVIILRRTRLRTRANKAESSTGLVRKSSAPASSPATRSEGWSSAVTITTGTCAVRGFGLDAAADLEAVHARHHDVEQNDVGLVLFDAFQRLLAAERRDDLEIFRRQLGFQQLDVREDVVDDQDAGGHAA